jgi:predicted metal-dependent hydrolase
LSRFNSITAEEAQIFQDPRFHSGVAAFNRGEWYGCHDDFEAVWHETQGRLRPLLQGILQIAVAHHHLERGNRRGATVLLGEGLGRLAAAEPCELGLNIQKLQQTCQWRLGALQQGSILDPLTLPRLEPCQEGPR